MSKLRFGQTVEDIGLAIQELRNEGRGLDACKVELTLEHHAGDMVRALMIAFPQGRIETRFVLMAADAVISRTTEIVLEHAAKLKAVPLVKTGQGDYVRETTEADVTRAETRAAARRCAWMTLCRRAMARVWGVA